MAERNHRAFEQTGKESFFDLVADELRHDDSNKILTENGAVAYASTLNNLVDFSYSVNSLRNKSASEVAARFEQCYKDNPELATKMLFQIGDVREGKGERRTFNIGLRYMALAHPEICKALLPLVPEYTRWDHVAEMATCGEPNVELFARRFVVEQLKKDYILATARDAKERFDKGMLAKFEYDEIINKCRVDYANATDGKVPSEEKLLSTSISLCAKWVPALGAKEPGHHKIAQKLARMLGKDLGISKKKYNETYRKTRSLITKHLHITERILSQKLEVTVDDLSKMTAANQLKLKNALQNAAGEKYDEYIEKVAAGEATINAGVITPADVVHRYAEERDGGWYWRASQMKPYDETLEQLWKNLPKIETGEGNTDVIVVRDDSGSMTTPCGDKTKMTCLEVATAFSIYCAEQLKGPYKGKFISFSEHPKYLDISGLSSLHDKLEYAYAHSEVANTNIEATFDLLLKTAVSNKLRQDQIPGCVLIFSDMEFDQGTYGRTNQALFENIRDKWKMYGYEMPVLAFWNLNVNRAVVPTVDERGVVLMSGYSKDNLDMLMSGELAKFTPEHQLEVTLAKPRYDAVGQAFEAGQKAEREQDSKHPRKEVSFREALPDFDAIYDRAVPVTPTGERDDDDYDPWAEELDEIKDEEEEGDGNLGW